MTKKHTGSRFGRRAVIKAIGGRPFAIETIEPRLLMSATGLTGLASFNYMTTGNTPNSDLVIDSSGNVFGTTPSGYNDNGTLFELQAGQSTPIVIHSFTGSEGASPVGGVVADAAGNIYGLTYQNGANNIGTLFELPHGSTTLIEVLSFDNSFEGGRPQAGLMIDSSGNLFGTTSQGGVNGRGTVFEYSTTTSTMSVVAPLSSSTEYVGGDLIEDSAGNLFGTSEGGGDQGAGSVFEVVNGSHAVTVLASFAYSSSFFYEPNSRLALDSSGNLYGTSDYGGPDNDGGIFEVPVGASTYTIVSTFGSSSVANPSSGVIIESNGDLLGTSAYGGDNGYGAVYVLPHGSSTPQVLSSFDSSTTGSGSYDNSVYDEFPIMGGLTLASNGLMYGAAPGGGASGDGTIFTYGPLVTSKAVVTAAPVTAIAGVTQSIGVSLEASNNAVDTSDTANVTLSISVGPPDATVGGTLTEAAVNGVATFSDLSFTKAGIYVITASSGGLTSGTTTIAVYAAAASQVATTSSVSNVVAGQTISTVTVNVEDAYGNRVTNNTSSITASGTTTLQGTTTHTAVGGVATFSNLSLTHAGQASLTFADGLLTSATTSTFNVTAGAAAALSITGAPSGATAGVTLGAITVAVTDAYGNVVTGNTSTVSIGTVVGGLTGTTSHAAVASVATFSNLSLSHSGSYLLTATDGLLTAASTSISVNPAAASGLHVSGGPGTVTAGTTLGSITVSIVDALGNVLTGDGTSVTVNGPASMTGALTTAAVNGVATFNNLSITRAGLDTLSFSDGLLSPGVTSSFNVLPAAASLLHVTSAPTTITAGSPISVAVQVRDAFGNVITGDQSAVTISAAGLTGTTTVSAVNGVATFTGLSINTAGVYTLTTTDGLLTADSSTILTVVPGVASQLNFVGLSPTVTAGTTFALLSIAVEDSFGNILTGSPAVITLSNGSVSLYGTATAVNGVATFSNLSISTAGTYTLSAADGLLNATSTSFQVTPAAATKLALLGGPSDTVAGGTLDATVVAVEDAFGNVVTSDTSTVTIGGASTLGGATTEAAVNGIATFGDLSITHAGPYSLQGVDGALAPTATSTFTITSAAGSQLFITSAPSVEVAGVTLGPIVVQMQDAFGNLATGDQSAVTLTSNTGVLGGTTTVSAVDGVATFSDLHLDAAGSYTLTVSNGSMGTDAAVVNVSAAPGAPVAATSIAAGTTINSAVASLASTITATARKQKVSVQITSTSDDTVVLKRSARLFANGTLNAGELKVKKAGDYTVSIITADGQTVTQTLTVLALKAVKVVFTANPVFTANHGSVSVELVDKFGNVTTSMDGQTAMLNRGVVWGSPTRVVLAGTITATIINGIATFDDVAVTGLSRGRLVVTADGVTAGYSTAFRSV